MAVWRSQAVEADKTAHRQDRRAWTSQDGKCRRLIRRYGRIIAAAAPLLVAAFSALLQCSAPLACCYLQHCLSQQLSLVSVCSREHRTLGLPPQLHADDVAGTSLSAGRFAHHPQPHQPYVQHQQHQPPQAASSGDPWRLAAAQQQQQQQHLQQQQQQQCLAPGSPTDTSMGDDWLELATGLQQPHQQEQLLHQYAQQEPLLEPASLLDVSAQKQLGHELLAAVGGLKGCFPVGSPAV